MPPSGARGVTVLRCVVAASRQTAIAVVVAGGILAVASFAEAYAEITPYFASGVADTQRFDALATGAFVPADSKWSRDLYLDDCLNVPSSIYALAQPSASRKRLLQACRDHAGRIVASAPTMSSAWLVLATTSAALEKRARFYFSTVEHELGEDWRHVHEAVLDHVRAQDADAADAVAHKHIEDTGKAVAALLFDR